METNSEVLPGPSMIEEFMKQVVRPTLDTIARDAERRLLLNSTVMQGPSEANQLGVLSVGSDQLPILDGSVRLRFREASGGRLRMHCEALFEQTDAVNNCSGFSLKGELKESTAKRMAWTMRYSVWHWTGWV
jgi:hypothetical protein